jgi:cell division protein FtsN
MRKRTVRGAGRRRRGGGTLVGLLLGLLVGLAIAAATAFYMTKSSVPFVDRVKRPSEPAAGSGGELPDPNRSMQRPRPASGEPPPAASVPGPASAPAPAPKPPAPAAPPPVAPPAAAAPAAAPPVSGSTAPADAPGERTTYLLQAGAFRSQEDAEGMKVRLALIGFEARIATAEVNNVTFYRVRVGPYAKLDDMNKARARLAENGIEASVVRQR